MKKKRGGRGRRKRRREGKGKGAMQTKRSSWTLPPLTKFLRATIADGGLNVQNQKTISTFSRL